jgi:hypothetical protein
LRLGALKLEPGSPAGQEMGVVRQGEDPSLNPPCRIQSPKLGVLTSCSVSAQDALTPAQPQLRLAHEQRSCLNGKGRCLCAHWGVILPVTYLSVPSL